MTRISHTRQQLIGKVSRALFQKDADTIATLLKEGMDPDLKLTNSSGSKRAVTTAVGFEDPEIFDLYVAYGADMNMPGVGSNNPLFLSVGKGDLRGVMRALAAGADVAKTRNRGSKQNEHVMHVAARIGNPAVTQLLMDAGGWQNLNNRDKTGRTPVQIAKDGIHRSVAGANTDARKESLAWLQHYETLPRLDFAGHGFSKADVFATDAEGHCPLEHPETWQRWGEVQATLALKGESITKADLQKTNAAGTTWLERAVSCFALPQVIAGLNAQGESLGAEDLLQSDGQPSPLLELVRGYRQLRPLFTTENCRHWSRDGLAATTRALDAYETRAFIPNLNQLRMFVSQHDSARQQGGRGR